MTRAASSDETPVLSALLEELQAAADLRRPLWGTLEALQAVARHLTHPREVLTLACEVAELGRRVLLSPELVLGLEDAAQAADEAAQQHHAAHELYLAERELCRALTFHRAEHEGLVRAHLCAALRALGRAIDGSGNPVYLVDVACNAYALGELRAEERPAAPPPDDGTSLLEAEGRPDAPTTPPILSAAGRGGLEGRHRMRLRDGRHSRECLVRRLYWLWALAEHRGTGRIDPSAFGPDIDGRAAVISLGIDAPHRLFPCQFREQRRLQVALTRRAA